MPAVRVTANTKSAAQDVNQIFDLLEGVSGFTLAYLLRAATGEDFIVRLSDNAGARSFVLQDSDGVEVGAIDSSGNLTLSGSLPAADPLLVPTSATPTPTTNGDMKWDSDDFNIVVGDGSGQKTFYPGINGAWKRVGHNTTEQSTTTGNVVVDLVAVTLTDSIPATTPLLIRFSYRKTSGIGQTAAYGLKVNSTTIFTPTGGGVGVAEHSSTDQNEDGWCEIYIGPRQTNYTASIQAAHHARVSSTGATADSAAVSTVTPTAVVPIEAVTSITITGNGLNTAHTIAVKDVEVFARTEDI